MVSATPQARRRKAILRVYQCNMSALMVFLECEWSLVATAGGAIIRTHFPATEIEAVMRQRQVPADEQTDVFLTVRIMQRAAQPLLNAAK